MKKSKTITDGVIFPAIAGLMSLSPGACGTENSPEIQRLNDLGRGLTEILSSEFDKAEFKAECYPQYEFDLACVYDKYYDLYRQNKLDTAPSLEIDLSTCQTVKGCEDPKLPAPFQYVINEERYGGIVKELVSDIFAVFPCQKDDFCIHPNPKTKTTLNEQAKTEWLVRGYPKEKNGESYPIFGLNLKRYCDVLVGQASVKDGGLEKAPHEITTPYGEVIFLSLTPAKADAAAKLLGDNLSYNKKECEDFNKVMNGFRRDEK